MAQFILYYSARSRAAKRVVPLVRRAVGKSGWEVRLVDVDSRAPSADARVDIVPLLVVMDGAIETRRLLIHTDDEAAVHAFVRTAVRS